MRDFYHIARSLELRMLYEENSKFITLPKKRRVLNKANAEWFVKNATNYGNYTEPSMVYTQLYRYSKDYLKICGCD